MSSARPKEEKACRMPATLRVPLLYARACSQTPNDGFKGSDGETGLRQHEPAAPVRRRWKVSRESEGKGRSKYSSLHYGSMLNKYGVLLYRGTE